jgi:hypothetical protein
MIQGKQSTPKSKFGHLLRVAVMFLSFGFIFPHVMTEDNDTTKGSADKAPGLQKKSPLAKNRHASAMP